MGRGLWWAEWPGPKEATVAVQSTGTGHSRGSWVKGPGEVLAQEEGRAVEAGRPSRWVDGVTWDVDFVLRVSKHLAGVGQGSDNG